MLREINLDSLGDIVDELASMSGDLSEVSFIFLYKGERFPVLVSVKNRYRDRLLVMYNGTVDRSKAQDGILFQRSSWISSFDGSVVSFADPTLLRSPDLAVGWGQIEMGAFAPEMYAEILVILRSTFSLPPATRTLHFGSSAGGFQAISTAVYDSGSTVLANNPQLDWTQYSVKWQVQQISRKLLNYEDEVELLAAEPWRAQVWKLIGAHGEIPRIYLAINISSENDFSVQLPLFLQGINDLRIPGELFKISVDFYRDEKAGHNPLPKSRTIEKVNELLARFEDTRSKPWGKRWRQNLAERWGKIKALI